MGIVLSAIGTLRAVFAELQDILARYQRISARIDQDPGIPVPNPTRSFWMHPLASLPDPSSDAPANADVVIIGSGITAASVARTLLANDGELVVVVLEARDACGGATGRNGGHIKPNLYEDYGHLKRKVGAAAAQKVIRFRQAHLSETIKLAEDEDVLESSGARQVQSLDVYYDATVFEDYRQRFMEWRNYMPEESVGFEVYEGEQARSKFHLADHCVGVIAGPAGALHPYRVITAVWKRLLGEHPDNFHLFTHTSCTSISSSSPAGLYVANTPRGPITTPHIVHASNAHVSHLLPRMRGKIIPVRATASAQRPGRASSPSTLDSGRSWLLRHDRGAGFDYLSQLPPAPSGEPGAMILGGGFNLVEDGLGEAALSDDSTVHPLIRAYLGGALPVIFGEQNWGAEAAVDESAQNDSQAGWAAGRVMAVWSGIVAYSADGHPWVGRVPPRISERAPPTPAVAGHKTAGPGEWIAAGYSGDGMTAALLSGRALAYMILGHEDELSTKDRLPEPFIITETRWANAKPEELMAEVAS